MDMNVAELLAWRKCFARTDRISERKAVAVKFMAQLNKPLTLKGWEVYELLHGTDFDTVARLLVGETGLSPC